MVQEYGTAPHIVSVAGKQRLEVRLDHKTSSQPFSDLSLAKVPPPKVTQWSEQCHRLGCPTGHSHSNSN